MISVYGLYRKDNNTLFYIGITNNIKRRINSHKSDPSSVLKAKIIRKVGFYYRIFWTLSSRKEAIEREKFLINYFGRRDLGTGILANMSDGGDGLIGHSELTKNILKLKSQKYTDEQVSLYIEEWENSNLNMVDFCQSKDIKFTTFNRWIRKYKPEKINKSTRFDPVFKENIIKQWEESCLSKAEFADNNNLDRYNLSDWTLKVNKRIRTFETPEYKTTMVEQFKKSGLSERKFAAQLDIPRSRLSSWIRNNDYTRNGYQK